MSPQAQLSAQPVSAVASKRKVAPKDDEDDSGSDSGSDVVSTLSTALATKPT